MVDLQIKSIEEEPWRRLLQYIMNVGSRALSAEEEHDWQCRQCLRYKSSPGDVADMAFKRRGCC